MSSALQASQDPTEEACVESANNATRLLLHCLIREQDRRQPAIITETKSPLALKCSLQSPTLPQQWTMVVVVNEWDVFSPEVFFGLHFLDAHGFYQGSDE